MNWLQAIFVAVLQGATELFPVSSLGHAVVVPALMGWHLDQSGPSFLPFLVMLHMGTATALLAYFWRDWWSLATGVLGVGTSHQVREARRVFALIVLATIPAVIVGTVLEHAIRALFASPVIAALFLVVNGGLLMTGERLRRLSGHRPLSDMRAADALIIGLFQCLAFIPGISRSGATMVGGLLRGVDHESAAHFSFLIATPVILGAAVKETPKLLHAGIPAGTFGIAAGAAIVAGLTAWASTAFLMRYFRGHDRMALDPFAWYCAIAGAASVALLLL